VSAYNSYGESSLSSYDYATTSSPAITWYTYTLSSGAVNYHEFYASAGTHYIYWEDSDSESGYCDIKVSARDGNGTTFFSSIDNSISGTGAYSTRSFDVSSSGYITITVQGYNSSSNGTYQIAYN
jgi:hypothetical protein